MHFATKSRRTQILVWLTWAITCLVFMVVPEQAIVMEEPVAGPPALAGVVTHDSRNGPLFPWQPRHRWRKWAWRQYCALRRAHRRAVWVARLARLALTGALTLAQLVDLVTQSQLRRHLGALPVLYALLEALRVREIINRHCPTEAEVPPLLGLADTQKDTPFPLLAQLYPTHAQMQTYRLPVAGVTSHMH